MRGLVSKRRLLAVVALSLLLTNCGGGESGIKGPAPQPIPPAPAAGVIGDGRLDQLLEWARASQDLPAITAVVLRQGQVAERGAVGLRSKGASVAVTTQDRWQVGSITKSMTGTLAALMVEDGTISWTTRPLDVWPELANTINAGFRETTLRELLSHTSGMERDVAYAGAADDAPGTTMQKRRAWVDKILARTPANAAGVQLYSNSGFIVAGAMLESAAGVPWETLMSTRVFAPLGMTHSGFGEPASPGSVDQPFGHLSRSGGYDPRPPGTVNDLTPLAIGPAGIVHTTLDDIASYLAAHLEGERGTSGLLTTASFVTLHAPVAPGYALGWVDEPRLMPFDTRGNWHNGSNGWWYAYLWFVPSCDCAAFIATNGGGDRANAAVSALDKLLRDRVAASP